MFRESVIICRYHATRIHGAGHTLPVRAEYYETNVSSDKRC